jgi:hypothetical protein
VCVLCRFPNRFVRFGALYVPNYIKNKNKRQSVAVPKDDSLMFPLAVNYDADIHDALASMRTLDGAIPLHAKYGTPVIFFLRRTLPSSLSNRVLCCLGKCIIEIICIMSIKLMVCFRKVFPVSCVR